MSFSLVLRSFNICALRSLEKSKPPEPNLVRLLQNHWTIMGPSVLGSHTDSDWIQIQIRRLASAAGSSDDRMHWGNSWDQHVSGTLDGRMMRGWWERKTPATHKRSKFGPKPVGNLTIFVKVKQLWQLQREVFLLEAELGNYSFGQPVPFNDLSASSTCFLRSFYWLQVQVHEHSFSLKLGGLDKEIPSRARLVRWQHGLIGDPRSCSFWCKVCGSILYIYVYVCTLDFQSLF